MEIAKTYIMVVLKAATAVLATPLVIGIIKSVTEGLLVTLIPDTEGYIITFITSGIPLLIIGAVILWVFSDFIFRRN
jgi:uncharacterized membrane protein YvlD (DUF360 family)